MNAVPVLVLIAAAGASSAAAQDLPDDSRGRVVVLEPQEWQGQGTRLGIKFAGQPVRVVGNATHPSGIDRVTVNGVAASITVQRTGVTRWVTTISGADASKRVEIIAYPRQGEPIVRIQNPDGTVQPTATLVPASPPGGTPTPLPSVAVVGRGQPLRVGLAALPQDARGAVLATLHGDASIVVATGDADLQVRPAGGEYQVLGRDGSVRHRVEAPTASAGATGVVNALVQEFGALQLERLAAPARTFGLQFSFPHTSDFRLGEGIEFQVRAERAGYLTIVDLGTDGTIAVLPLLSNGPVRVEAGQPLLFPTDEARAQYAPDPPYKASPPAGTGVVRAFVTPRPIQVPDVASGGPITVDVFLRALRDATPGGEPWATAVLRYRILP